MFSKQKNCHGPRIEVRPTALPRYHAYTRWASPLPATAVLGSATPHACDVTVKCTVVAVSRYSTQTHILHLELDL